MPLSWRTIAVSTLCATVAFGIYEWRPHAATPSTFALSADVDLNDRDIELRVAAVRRAVELKDAIIDDLLAGRIDFAAAVSGFESVNTLRPDDTARLRLLFAGETDVEIFSNQVLCFLKSRFLKPAEAGQFAKWEASARKFLESRRNARTDVIEASLQVREK